MDNNSGTAPLKITINGQELDQSEVEETYSVGKQTRELEAKYNTTFDKVWPEYGRLSQEKKQLEDELASFKQKSQEGSATKQDAQDVKTAAASAGMSLEDLKKAGVITNDQLDSLLDEKLKKRDEFRQATDSVLAEASKLEKEIDGSDGRPKFKKAAVLAYANQYGFKDLTEAYDSMWEDEVKAWKTAQIDKEKRKGLQTQDGGGKKEPKTPRIGKSNIDSILKESLWGASEE